VAGTVTAVAAGTVTITAQAQGKSATTTIEVVPRPVADWSQATTEWSTHQGNPDHTGFIAAILDPTIFSVRWSGTPFGTAPLNPATFGPGSVFVSTETYFGTQKLAGFDILTGQSRWTKDFGAIHGVHPPAYGNGTVFVTTSGHEDSFLYALDPATGVERFKSPYGNQWSTYYAPVIVGQRVYMAGGYADGMYSFDATSGAQAWFYSTAQFSLWTPAVRNGVVYAYTGKVGAQLEAVDAQSGALLYQIADPHFSSFTYSMNTAPVLGAQQDLLVTQSGRLVSFDLGSRTIRWELKDNFNGTVTTAADQIYVVNGNAVDVRREDTGALLWSWTPPVTDTLWNTTVLTRNLLFASTEAYTFAIDLTVRRHVWSYPAGGHLSLSPQGVLLIAGDHGVVTALTVR
jgi:outer membrane protein assembly factor BamB